MRHLLFISLNKPLKKNIRQYQLHHLLQDFRVFHPSSSKSILHRDHNENASELKPFGATKTMETTMTMLKTVSESDPSVTGSNSSKEGEKTIPFLRRLVDMLIENDEIISFYPGVEADGQKLLGRIVVHDRARVETEILPRYFSHSSFASLRRQLNYFAFTRVGKGRQRGATYCNEAVVVLDDILHLKRRPNGSTANIAEINENSVDLKAVPTTQVEAHEQNVQLDNSHSSSSSTLHSSIRKVVVPFVHLPKSRSRSHDDARTSHRSKKMRRFKTTPSSPPIISPLSTSPAHSSDEESEVPTHHQRIVLDLTLPASHVPSISARGAQSHPSQLHLDRGDAAACKLAVGRGYDDEEILAGCSALLSFAQSGLR